MCDCGYVVEWKEFDKLVWLGIEWWFFDYICGLSNNRVWLLGSYDNGEFDKFVKFGKLEYWWVNGVEVCGSVFGFCVDYFGCE